MRALCLRFHVGSACRRRYCAHRPQHTGLLWQARGEPAACGAEVGNGHSTGTVDGIRAPTDTTVANKGWNITVALGSIAFAYSYSYILLEMTVR